MNATIVQQILQARKIAYALTDRNLIIRELHGLLEIIAVDQKNWSGRSLVEVFPELLGNQQDLEDILCGKLSNLSLEYVNREMPDGKTRYLDMELLPYRDAGGEILGILHLVQDITVKGELEQQVMQKRNQLQLLQAQIEQQNLELLAANQELEAFAYTVSHDLRAPLRAIDGYSRMLQVDYAKQLDEDGQAFLNNIRQAAQNMDRLIEDLLQLSRVSRSEMNRISVDLSGLARKVVNELARLEPDRAVAFQIQADMIANGDPHLLRVALENLLGNAWKFTTRTTQPYVEIGSMQLNGSTVYFVRDNGAGFDMRYATKLFQPFQRLHTPNEFAGTGVGLATVQRIIHRHGGRIWTEASINQGATFFFTLPE